MRDSDDKTEVKPEDLFPEYASLNAAELARAMDKVGQELAAADTIRKKLQARYDFLRLNALPGRMETEGLDLFKLDGVGRVSITADMWVSVPDAVKAKFYEWLEAEGHGDLIKPTVNASSLKAMVKQCMKDGKPVPGDLIKVQPFQRAVITRTGVK